MRITTLIENDTIDRKLKKAHGLSLFIEIKDHNILFDLGPNKHFVKNAKQLDLSIQDVDTAIISHGHFDHGNGLKAFLKENSQATVYASEHLFDKQYKILKGIYVPIGVRKPKDISRIKFIHENTVLDEGITLFTSVTFKDPIIGDNSLLTKTNGHYIEEMFDHEIYLVIEEEDNVVLFSGCSHKGIENIIDQLESQLGKTFTHIIGGYHFTHYDGRNITQTKYLEDLAEEFSQKEDVTYYSCHCTGEDAYRTLKSHMREKLSRIKTGSVIEI